VRRHAPALAAAATALLSDHGGDTVRLAAARLATALLVGFPNSCLCLPRHPLRFESSFPVSNANKCCVNQHHMMWRAF
jgi:hypothetical protein